MRVDGTNTTNNVMNNSIKFDDGSIRFDDVAALLFGMLDKNNDNKLDRAERIAGGVRYVNVDRNKDMNLREFIYSKSENQEAMAAKLFTKIDKNSDGVLSRKELSESGLPKAVTTNFRPGDPFLNFSEYLAECKKINLNILPF